MKIKGNVFSLSVFLFQILLFLTPLCVVASQNLEGKIYVWEFATRDGERNDYTRSLTEEFEEALIQSECCEVLQRRLYARLFDQKQSERSIMKLDGAPEVVINNLRSLEAETVVFGEVYDDTNSGQVKVTINFESFAGRIIKKASTYLAKYDLANPAKRELAVENIMEELNISPAPGSKTPLDKKTFGDWEFSLIGCIQNGNTATCNFVVTSKYRDRNFALYGGGNPRSLAFDEHNYVYVASSNSVKVANVQSSNRRLLVADVPATCSISFPNISTRTTKFTKLQLRISGDDLSEEHLEFRNVPIK